jgi:pSer/pThr/pTyr-binding forkhead associated (FHA) protein
VLNTGRLVECPRYNKVIIGRSDPTIEETPDIDLTQDKAAELGVSRRHASLTFRDDQVFLTDLGSTNRTFINRKPLQREQPYEIHNGDEIRLGNIILKVILNEEFSLG